MKHQTPAELLDTTSWWTLIELVVMIFSALLFSSDPGMYYLNSAFLTKMVCLLAAIVFNYTIHCAGRGIGYIDRRWIRFTLRSTGRGDSVGQALACGGF
jgi:hypothetical protein